MDYFWFLLSIFFKVSLIVEIFVMITGSSLNMNENWYS